MALNKAVSRATDILRLISSSKQPHNLTQISKALSIPKASVFDILHTLLEKGIVEFADKDSKTFSLGLSLFEIVLPAISNIDILKVARPFLEDLCKKSGETIFLAVENGGQLVYLDKVEGSSMIRATVELGARSDMHCTALGKAILAGYSENKLKEIFEKHNFFKWTAKTIVNITDLGKDLIKTRERGFAIDLMEKYINVVCVGAPIYSITNKPIAGISMAFHATNTDLPKLLKFGKDLESIALKISKKLGYANDAFYKNI